MNFSSLFKVKCVPKFFLITSLSRVRYLLQSIVTRSTDSYSLCPSHKSVGCFPTSFNYFFSPVLISSMLFPLFSFNHPPLTPRCFLWILCASLFSLSIPPFIPDANYLPWIQTLTFCLTHSDFNFHFPLTKAVSDMAYKHAATHSVHILHTAYWINYWGCPWQHFLQCC